MDKLNKSVEFWVFKGKHHSVSIKAWSEMTDYKNMQKLDEPVEKWNWNVYAYIFESHPLFSEPAKAKECLFFSGGCTYDQIKILAPAEGVKYDWQKEVKILVLGSDYNHSWDDYDNHPSPDYCIPLNVMRDAKELLLDLDKYIEDEQ